MYTIAIDIALLFYTPNPESLLKAQRRNKLFIFFFFAFSISLKKGSELRQLFLSVLFKTKA